MEEFILTKDQIQIIWMKGNVYGFKEAREMSFPNLKNKELEFEEFFNELKPKIKSIQFNEK